MNLHKTKIDWATHTWNPVTGCLHDCEYCYARRFISRFAPHACERPSEPMPEDDLHVRIPVPIGKTVYRVHPNPACHYGVRAAERAVFGRVITPRYVVTPVPFAVEMMRELNRTVFARVLDAERRACLHTSAGPSRK